MRKYRFFLKLCHEIQTRIGEVEFVYFKLTNGREMRDENSDNCPQISIDW